MQLQYRVNSISAEPVEVQVEVNGQTVLAKISGVCLELVALDGSTSPTFRFVPSNVGEAIAAFEAGQIVNVTIEPA